MFKIESTFRKCQKKKKKKEKIFFVSEIIASENIAMISSVKKRILVIGSSWVQKMF